MSLDTIKPYYQDASCTIYHGDCREILTFLPKFDLLLTDPPYGIGHDGKKGDTRRKGHVSYGWDKLTPSADAFRLIIAACKNQIIWGGNYFTPHLPPSMGWLVWDKGQRIAQSDAELAFTSFQKALRVKTIGRLALAADGTIHPTQKPLALMRWCLSLVPDAETILDPFAGSCTTGVAAKLEGRKSVLIEMNESYCEAGAKRLSQSVLF